MTKKSMAKNSLYNILYKMLNVFYPLVTSAYISRILLPGGVGKVALVQTIISYFTTVAALGIPNYGVKIIGGVQESKEQRSKNFCELFIINLISSLFCYAVFCLSYRWLAGMADGVLLVVFSSQILLNIINVDWFYQGVEEYGYIAVRSTIVKFCSLMLMFLFVKDRNDCIVYGVILCLATCGNYFFNIIHMRKYVQFTFMNLKIQRHLKTIFILLASVCATEIYTMLDSTMVGLICSEKELGYYSNAIRIVRSGFSVMAAMCAVYLPRLSFLYKENKKMEFANLSDQGLKLCMYLAIPCAVGLGLVADLAVELLYGQAFSNAINTVRILSILLIVFSFAYIAGHVILIAANKEASILSATMVGAVVNFALNMVLIRTLGHNGAAIATVIAETSVTLMLYVKTKSFLKHNISIKYWASVLVPTVIMSCVVCVCRYVITNSLLELIISVIIGVGCYVGVSIALKNEIIVQMVSSLKRLIKH